MVVVADTSPINYLVLISRIDLPASLYTRMLIPPAVLAELKHPVAPKIVRDWAYSAPVWLEFLSPMRDLILPSLDQLRARRSRSQPRCMPKSCSWMSRLGSRKHFEGISRLRAGSPFSVRLIRPGSSFSMTRSLNWVRPASAFRRWFSQRSGKSDLAKGDFFTMDERHAARGPNCNCLTGIPSRSIESMYVSCDGHFGAGIECPAGPHFVPRRGTEISANEFGRLGVFWLRARKHGSHVPGCARPRT